MKKIIVLGATGNTGAYLIDYLFENIDKMNLKLLLPVVKRQIFLIDMV